MDYKTKKCMLNNQRGSSILAFQIVTISLRRLSMAKKKLQYLGINASLNSSPEIATYKVVLTKFCLSRMKKENL